MLLLYAASLGMLLKVDGWIEDMWVTRKVRRYYRRRGYKHVRPTRIYGPLVIIVRNSHGTGIVEPTIPKGPIKFLDFETTGLEKK